MSAKSLLDQIKPTSGYLLIAPEEAQKQTSSGIYLPDNATGEKPQQGTVLAVGEGKRLDNGTRAPFNVKKGDEIIFTSYAGTEIKLDGEEHIIIREDDVLAILE